MAKLGCAKCGGKVKMATGGAMPKVLAKAKTQLYGIPQENMGTSSQYGFGRTGGSVKKMEVGGASGCPKGYIWDGKKCTKIIIDSKVPKNPRIYKPTIAKNGGATKATKFAALAPPYNKATAADRIAGAKKKK
jgi:hypothetical protein